MQYALALSFCAAFALSLAGVLVVRRAAMRTGFVDHPRGRKAHGRPVPLGGGLAIALAACLPLLVVALGALLLRARPDLVSLSDSLLVPLRQATRRVTRLLVVLGGAGAIVLLGAWDDAHHLSPRAKLLGQVLVALGVALMPGLRITAFIPNPWIHVLLTATWLVLLMNSFNLLDNMDGQSALVAFLTAGALLIVALQTEQNFVAGMLLCLMGAVLGFLVFNLPPASIFMGDAGSMFLGYMLAMGTILCSFTFGGATEPAALAFPQNPIFPVVLPLIIFAVPLYDSLSVIAIRFHLGRPLMEGDRNHFSHRLVRLGMSEPMVLCTVGCTVLATSLGATVPYGGEMWRAVVPAVQALAVLLVIVQLEWVARSGSA
jgi:UDP-GlcNAc:undecaprenyl-phosphate GlcNAc-1-phosphate transferase